MYSAGGGVPPPASYFHSKGGPPLGARKQKQAVINQKLTWKKSFKKYAWLYVLLIPGVLWYIIFKYLPMFGIVIAFEKYGPFTGIKGMFTAKWVGWYWFRKFFKSIYAKRLITNSLVISLKKLIVCFPSSILLAILLNAIPGRTFKKSIQTISYLPHFLSAVVVASIVRTITSTDGGLINLVIRALGGEPVFFLGSNKYFQGVLVVTELWKTIGWNSIIYLAAMTGIDPALYEAATVDGANWHHKIWHITIPAIAPIISLMLILRCGELMNAGFEMTFNLYSAAVYETGDIIDTYVYREGLTNMNYSSATAVNVFKSVVSLVLVLGSNFIAKRMGQEGIW